MKTDYRFALFDFVKLVLSILVINLHVESFLTGAPFSLLYYLGKFAVPLFIIFNFYFNGKYYLWNTDSHLVISKLKRLLVPFLGWSFVGFLASPHLITFKYLARQLTMGTAVDAPLYYLLAVFWISILYFAISKYIKQVTYFHLGLILAVLAYELLGFNKIIAAKLPIQIEFFVSRVIEFTKYASIGILLSSYKERLQILLCKYSTGLTLLATLAPMLLAIIYWISGRIDLDYSGPWLYSVSLLIMLAIIINSYKNLPAWVEKLAHFGTYSLGLYCIHNLFLDLVIKFAPSLISYGNIVLSLAIIALSLSVSVFMSRTQILKPLVQ